MRPVQAGLPSKFEEWRKGQEHVVRRLLFSTRRFQALILPVGSGKSATYMAYLGIKDEERGAILCPTKALMDQLRRDFKRMGLAKIMGRDNYVCAIDDNETAGTAKCTLGEFCEQLKDTTAECRYYRTLEAAAASRLVLTNTKYWLHDEESGKLGAFDKVVVDEAHKAPGEISDYASVEVTNETLRDFHITPLEDGEHFTHWAMGAVGVLDAQKRMARVMSRSRRRRLISLMRDLSRLARLSAQDWLFSHAGGSYRWDLIDPGALAEPLLFRGADTVILSSATLTRKILKQLRVGDDVEIIEQGSTFPVNRRPIYYWPMTRVSRDMSSDDVKTWATSMDYFAARRMDRCGVMHSHSYTWGERYVEQSALKSTPFLLLHRRGQPVKEVVEQYRDIGKRRPVMLISPAVYEGLDFAYKQCEFQIVAKIPFPDLSDPLVKARSERDKDYGKHVATQNLQQAVGRGMRAIDDQCETLIADGNFGWLRYNNRAFFMGWFDKAVRTILKVSRPPDPPPPLAL